MIAKVAEHGQVTIPESLCQRLGIEANTFLDFKEENGRLVAEKISAAERVALVYGVIQTGKTTDEVMQELRGAGEW